MHLTEAQVDATKALIDAKILADSVRQSCGPHVAPTRRLARETTLAARAVLLGIAFEEND